MRRLLVYILIIVFSLPAFAGDTEHKRRLKNGAKAFEYCANCHTLQGIDEARFGPDLFGVVGRPIASIQTYAYSDALKMQEGIWSKEALNRFIARPTHAVEGTKMPYAGLLSPHARADLIAYLEAVGTGEINHDIESKDLLELAFEQGNPDEGALLFTPCLTCHTATSHEGHKVGPNLYGVMGRPIASAKGFNYSNRLRRRDGNWTQASLNAFFFESKAFDQGTHLAYRQLNRLEDRSNLIAYLGTLKD